MDEVMYLPEARKNIVHMLEVALTAFIDQMQQESFSDPYITINLSLMLEANATALARLVATNPDADALLKTYAVDILDKTKE